MTWRVTNIQKQDVRAIWPVVAPLLAPAIKRSGGRVTMATVFEGLQTDRYLLWVAYPDDKVVRAAFLSRVSVYPARRMLTIDAAGGTGLDEWLEEVVRTFRAFSRQSGLDGVEMFGRNGWARALGKHGWVQTGILCEIDA